MKRIAAWLAEWDVSEDEPTWLQVIETGVLFVVLMAVVYQAILVAGTLTGAV